MVSYPFCSIIVLNYYGEKIIRDTVHSLLKLNYPKEKYEIIIVDNNSKDNSRKIIDRLAEKYKIIRTIYLDKNLGFSRGNNVGIKNAKGVYVILLNNDCVVDKNWLMELVQTAEKSKKIFAVNSKILLHRLNFKRVYKKPPKKIQNAGIIVFQDGYGRDIGAVVKYQTQDYERDIGQYDKEKEIYAACGAAILLRKSLLDKLGFLDGNFFMYYEDVEISERARLHGYKIIYAPKAIVKHLHAFSSKEWSASFIYHTEKGRLLHVFYHFPILVCITEYLKFFGRSFARLFDEFFLVKKFHKNIQYVRVCFYILLNLPFIITRRLARHKNIPRDAIRQNYQQILRGFWYVN